MKMCPTLTALLRVQSPVSNHRSYMQYLLEMGLRIHVLESLWKQFSSFLVAEETMYEKWLHYQATHVWLKLYKL